MARINWNGTPEERFWKRVVKTNTCWIWNGKMAGNGYGQFLINYKGKYAHRFSYELHKGEIPKGLCVCHTCDNPPCVNPNHLWLGTRKQNSQDMTRKGRHVNNRGENAGMAKLSWKQIDKIRRLYIPRKYGRYKLGIDFGVSPSTIRAIIKKETWVR